MKKILIIIIILILAIISISVLVKLSSLVKVKYSPDSIPESLYNYLTDSDLRQQYHKYKACKPYTSEETCSAQPTCVWQEEWLDTMSIDGNGKIEYCVNKDYKDYIRIKNERNRPESKPLNFEL